MKALILAAGYATRLRPLTDTLPKQLLPVGGRPMVDWIVDKIRETDVGEIHLVTNARFADDFARWAPSDVRVHDDGTTSNEDRLGAIGDIRFVRERANVDDDLLVIAGDNLFDFSLAELESYWRAHDGSSCVAVHDVGDRELAKKYGIVATDDDDRVVSFLEKPEEPPSTLAATATYLYARDHVALVDEYLESGNPPDQPGNLVAWLVPRVPVYAYRLSGPWWVDPDTLERSMYDVLVHKISIREVIRKREIDVACASIDLAGAEIAMSTMIGRERSLQKAFEPILTDYDFICIDTPPSLGLLTINALTAADKVIVPVQCEYLSMRGLIQLQNTLAMIRENLNPNVDIEGILPTLVDSRTIHAKEAIEILEENFGDRVFASRIRKTVRFAEAPVKGMSVLKYEPDGVAAQSYRQLAQEVLTHGQR